MSNASLIRGFSNIGWQGAGRAFTGFPDRLTATDQNLGPRGLLRLELGAGDVVSLRGVADKVLLFGFDGRGQPALYHLGLSSGERVAITGFNADPLLAWARSNGGRAELIGLACAISDLTVFKARDPLTLWIALPVEGDAVAAGHAASQLTISHKVQSPTAPLLPPALGHVLEEFTVARGSAMAYELKAGQALQIIDVEGQQCSDFMAFRSHALARGEEMMIDGTATRSMVHRSYPGPGLYDKFYDRDMRPMLQVLQDTCGRHDTFGLACTARGYEDRGFPGHLNCSDNISYAMDPYGVARRPAWPAINFFWNTWVDQHSHHLMTAESYSRPGDYVAMRALEDLVCVSTACPDDLDPINGWNPTDIHVRIYTPEAPIQRAVAYRPKEDAPMTVSHDSAFHPRTGALTDDFAPARDIWVPVSYQGIGTVAEYWACRDAATLQDMSGLRKYDVVGPDAERLLQLALTRNVAKLAQWRGTYALLCDDTGAVIDDGTLFRLDQEIFRWCCGHEESARHLKALADAEGLQVQIIDMNAALVNLALQGPRSRDVLRKLCFTQPQVPSVDQLKWFGVTVGRLHDRDGPAFMLSRTGYTGELGYELFCSPADAVALWDAVMAAGVEHGLKPMGGAALEIIRIEAGLAAAGAEFRPGVDAFEAGLGFAVDLKKSHFLGRDALERNSVAPRKLLKGLIFEGDDVPQAGAPVLVGERQIGEVTSATRSPTLEQAIAFARLSVEHAEIGTQLVVGQMDGRMKRLSATVADIPFVDPKRERARV